MYFAVGAVNIAHRSQEDCFRGVHSIEHNRLFTKLELVKTLNNKNFKFTIRELIIYIAVVHVPTRFPTPFLSKIQS